MRIILLFAISVICINSQSQTGYIFKNDLKDSLIGVVDLKGNIVIKNEYSEFRALHGYILGKKFNEQSSSLFTSNGFMIKDGITYFFEFGNNKYLLLHQYEKDKEGKWALYDVKGQKNTDFIYDDIIHSSELADYAQVIRKTKYILIDTLGNELFHNKDKKAFKEQVQTFKREQNIGEEDFMIEMGSDNTEEPEIFKDSKSLKYGLRFRADTLVEAKYEEIKWMCCKSLIVKLDSEYGVISTTGKTILKPEFDNIENIAYWKIIARYKGKYGVYNARTGNIIIKPSFGYLKFL